MIDSKSYKLSDIKLSPNNPRLIKDENFKRLVSSIHDFPKMMDLRPIVVDKDMVILGGNMRYRALKEAGYTEIPNKWVKIAEELTDDEKKRFIIEDNVQNGDWDYDMLANEWSEYPLADWGINVTGWIDQGNPDENKMWEGMPEFSGLGNNVYKTIFIHFETEEAMNKFNELLGEDVSLETKYIWYPHRDRQKSSDLVVKNEP